MIRADITLKEIDYEKSFANLFPMGIQKCSEMETPNLAVRFLLKMGDASMIAALGILNLMNEKSKKELLCGFVNLYCQEIQSALNEHLKKDELARYICIGDIYMVQDSVGHLSFVSRNIEIDYNGLVKNDTVKQKIGGYASETIKKTIFGEFNFFQKMAADGAGFAAEIAVGAAPGEVEKTVLFLINQKENKGRLLQMAEQVLAEKGLYVKLEDFVFVKELSTGMQDEAIVEEAKGRKFELSPALEEELLSAAAGYLKMLLGDEQTCEEEEPN